MHLGAWIGRQIFRLSAKERAKALDSLAVAFPQMPLAERKRLALRAFEHLGRCMGELCELNRIDPMLEQYVELPESDRAVIEAAVAEGKGVLFVTGHVGNFELMARRVARLGHPCKTIAREASDPRTTAFIEGLRASGSIKTVWRGSPTAAREMLRALKSGELLGMLIDQDTRVQGVFVDFFGKPAHTPRAPGDLAVRTGAAVVLGFIEQKPEGGHRVRISRIRPPSTGDREADALALTAAMSRAIEEAIRQTPHAWVWMHQRWKTRPEPGAAP